MSEIYELDVNGDGNPDVVEVTEYGDGSTLVVADLDGDGYGDVAAYDADGDGVADEVATADEDVAATGGEYPESQPASESAPSEPVAGSGDSSGTGTGATYSEWAAEQNYQEAYRESVYGDKNDW